MKRSFFLVANPTHYINALEAIDHYQDRFDYKVLIVISEYIEGIESVDNYLNTSDLWEERHILDLRAYPWPASDYRSWRRCYNEAWNIIKSIKFDDFVSGNLHSAIFYSLLIRYKDKYQPNIIATDDGTPSIKILNSRKQGKEYFEYHFRSLRIFAKTLVSLRSIFFFNKCIRPIEFFTIFDLEAYNNDIIIKNNFNKLKKLNSKNSLFIEKTVHFIGTHIVEKGIVKKDRYLEFLQRIKQYYEQRELKILYIQHRGESSKNLKDINDIIEVVNFNVPLEFYYTQNKKPEVIAGLFSSALFTLSQIHENIIKFDSFYLNEDDLRDIKSEPKSYILSIYEAIKKNSNIYLNSDLLVDA